MRALDLDDRMAAAVDLINAALERSDFSELKAPELAALRDRYGYRACIAFLAAIAAVDLSTPLSLLDEWHAWHGA